MSGQRGAGTPFSQAPTHHTDDTPWWWWTALLTGWALAMAAPFGIAWLAGAWP